MPSEPEFSGLAREQIVDRPGLWGEPVKHGEHAANNGIWSDASFAKTGHGEIVGMLVEHLGGFSTRSGRNRKWIDSAHVDEHRMLAALGVETHQVDGHLAKISNAKHLRKTENPDQPI